MCRLKGYRVSLACAEHFCSPFANAVVYLPGFFGVLEVVEDITYDRLNYPAAVARTSLNASEVRKELSIGLPVSRPMSELALHKFPRQFVLSALPGECSSPVPSTQAALRARDHASKL